MNLETIDEIIRDIKELNPYKELWTPLSNQYTCCVKNKLISPFELQLQATFFDKKVEIMIFPHPIIIQKNIIPIIRFVNELNSYVNTYDLYGKIIVLSDSKDIAFATKLPYSYIENCSDYFFYAIKKPIQILTQVLPIVFDISTGRITYEKGFELLEKMWG